MLFEDYSAADARILIYEMAELLIQELLSQELVTKEISLHIGYSGYTGLSSGGSKQLPQYTDFPKEIQKAFHELYDAKVCSNQMIRNLNLSLGKLQHAEGMAFQNDLFQNVEDHIRDKTIEKVMMEIKRKHGKNAILRGIDYMPKATLPLRNTLIGGHHA